MRNGDVADRLRKAGSPYKIIFGLLVPQIEQIAATVTPSSELADELWRNISTRESRLLATMVFPQNEFTILKAREWIASADTKELIDMLCFRMVRNLADAELLIAEYGCCKSDLMRYFALRLSMNLLIIGKLKDLDSVYDFAEQEYASNNPATRNVALQVMDEIEFLKEDNPNE